MCEILLGFIDSFFFPLQVSANTEDSTMSGYLHRSKGSKKPWKHLWFVIKNKVLYTYAASEVRDHILETKYPMIVLSL